jgi:protein-disulfide isomerase
MANRWLSRLTRGSMETVFSGIIAACAVAMAVGYVGHLRKVGSGGAGRQEPVRVKNWRDYAAGELRFGPANAPVTITQFSDFQCPFCRRFKYTLDTVLSLHPSDVAVVYRNLPIDRLHPHARGAAVAGVCAGRQGRFRQIHDAFYADPESLAAGDWMHWASEAGVPDLPAFAQCLAQAGPRDLLTADSLAAKKLRVTGTPTVLVNGWRINGPPTISVLEELIDRAKKDKAR